jgi:DNA-binding response OmpR family regulator
MLFQNDQDTRIIFTPEQISPVTEHFRRLKVLIIDDDQHMRLLVSEFLIDEGFLIQTSKDAESGFEVLRYSDPKPDLILLDVMMPEFSGLDFRKWQQDDPHLKDIPVIFITGMGPIESENYLLKPFSKEELSAEIRYRLFSTQ